MSDLDAIILGAGPAGLGAGLSLARAGASVAVLDGADRVGGLCVTRSRDGLTYDVGGHILFVRDHERERWLRELLGEDLLWVERPVACIRDGSVVAGRYLDQRPTDWADAPPVLPRPDQGGADYLAQIVAPSFRDSVMRGYLEKVDRMALEQIPATRVGRLLLGQSAPHGFHYPAHGIGQLMETMAASLVDDGGQVLTGARATRIATGPSGVTVTLADGRSLTAARLVVAIPPAQAAALVDAPGLPPEAGHARAVALVYLEVARDRLTDEAWIQCDDDRVPFARLAEPANWSPALVNAGRSVVCCECYFEPTEPAWRRSDEELARACAEAIANRLELTESVDAIRLVEVVRLPCAYTLAPVTELAAASARARWLDAQPGVAIAQAGAVIEAIEAGERAAAE